MSRIFWSVVLAACVAAACGGGARAVEMVYITDDSPGHPAGFAPYYVDRVENNPEDSVIFVSPGAEPVEGTGVLNFANNPAGLGFGVKMDGSTHTAGLVTYDQEIHFALLKDTTVTGDVVLGNGAKVETSVIPVSGSNANLTVGGNIILGYGTGDSKLKVQNILTMTGTGARVEFKDTASRLEAQYFVLGDGATVTVSGGYPSAFTVMKQSTIGGGTKETTLRLDGNTMAFVEGVTLASGGVIKSVREGSELYLGEYRNIPADGIAPTAGVLTLAGGTLDGSAARLTIVPKADTGGTPRADASMKVTAASVIKGDVNSGEIATDVQSQLRVYNDNGRGTWLAKKVAVASGGSLVLGEKRPASDPDNINGVVRIAGTDESLTVASGGRIVSEGYDFGVTASGLSDRTRVLTGNNIIGSGAANRNRASLVMNQGSTLDLTNGGLFIDAASATLNGNITFGGGQGGEMPFAIVATGYTLGAGNSVNLGNMGNIAVGSSATITLDHRLAANFKGYDDPTVANDKNTLINVAGKYLGIDVGLGGSLDVASSLLGEANAIDMGFYGKFTLALDADGKRLYISKVERSALLDGSQEGLDQLIGAIRARNGVATGNPALVTNIYRYVSQANSGELSQLVADSGNMAAYNMLTDYFNAVIQGWVPSGEESAANMLIGAGVGRVSSVVLDNMTRMADQSFRHAGSKRNQVFAMASAASDAAYASPMDYCGELNRIWVSPYGVFDVAKTIGGLDGYEHDTYGISVGYDRALGPLVVGGNFTYAYSDFNDKSSIASDTTLDTYAANIYGTYGDASGLFVTGAAGYAYTDNYVKELRRTYVGGVPVDHYNRGDYHNNSWYLGLEVGYDWQLSECLTVSPSIGVTHVRTTASDHEETWGGAAIARYSGIKAKSTLLPVRVEAEYAVLQDVDRGFSLTGNLGYSYNFSHDDLAGNVLLGGFTNSTPIAATGRKAGKNSLNVGAGMKYYFGRYDFNLKYDYYRRTGYSSNQVQAMLGVNF